MPDAPGAVCLTTPGHGKAVEPPWPDPEVARRGPSHAFRMSDGTASIESGLHPGVHLKARGPTMTRTTSRRRLSAVAAAVAAVVGLALAAAPSAVAKPPGHWATIKPAVTPSQLNPRNPWPLVNTTPDALRFDDTGTTCSGGPQPGTVKLAAFVEHWWPRGENWGIYNCRTVAGTATNSEHAEGRAYDHALDVDNADDRAAAQSLITSFTKDDSNGNHYALARRFGIEEIIWNCQIWSSNKPWFKEYKPNNCAGLSKTEAHRDHVHIGQNWRGANQNTSAYDGFAIWVEDAL
jgi:hypothetical protein